MAIKLNFQHTNNSWLSDNGYTKKEQELIYDRQLKDIIENTREYLDNLKYLREYKVYWGTYSKRATMTATMPRKLMKTLEKKKGL
jgi:hypothetical protein